MIAIVIAQLSVCYHVVFGSSGSQSNIATSQERYSIGTQNMHKH